MLQFTSGKQVPDTLAGRSEGPYNDPNLEKQRI